MEMFFVAQANYAYDVWHIDNAFLMFPTVRQNFQAKWKIHCRQKETLNIWHLHIFSLGMTLTISLNLFTNSSTQEAE